MREDTRAANGTRAEQAPPPEGRRIAVTWNQLNEGGRQTAEGVWAPCRTSTAGVGEPSGKTGTDTPAVGQMPRLVEAHGMSVLHSMPVASAVASSLQQPSPIPSAMPHAACASMGQGC